MSTTDFQDDTDYKQFIQGTKSQLLSLQFKDPWRDLMSKDGVDKINLFQTIKCLCLCKLKFKVEERCDPQNLESAFITGTLKRIFVYTTQILVLISVVHILFAKFPQIPFSLNRVNLTSYWSSTLIMSKVKTLFPSRNLNSLSLKVLGYFSLYLSYLCLILTSLFLIL